MKPSALLYFLTRPRFLLSFFCFRTNLSCCCCCCCCLSAFPSSIVASASASSFFVRCARRSVRSASTAHKGFSLPLLKPTLADADDGRGSRTASLSTASEDGSPNEECARGPRPHSPTNAATCKDARTEAAAAADDDDDDSRRTGGGRGGSDDAADSCFSQ